MKLSVAREEREKVKKPYSVLNCPNRIALSTLLRACKNGLKVAILTPSIEVEMKNEIHA